VESDDNWYVSEQSCMKEHPQLTAVRVAYRRTVATIVAFYDGAIGTVFDEEVKDVIFILSSMNLNQIQSQLHNVCLRT
jgi:hypothetical protein